MPLPSHRSRIQQRVRERLGKSAPASQQQLVERYRQFLKVEEHRLKLAHQAGDSGRQLVRKRAELVSEILCHIWDHVNAAAPLKSPAVLLAVGGFGRGELSPHSDIDLLFLHQDGAAVSPALEENISRVLYLLWDIGFKIGHSTRSLDEVFVSAEEDLRTKAALLEIRFLAGDKTLFTQFERQFYRRCIHGQKSAFVAWRLQDQALRHAKHGNTVFLQEPNIKTSCGGLRDYQSLLWTARVAREIRSTLELEQAGLITHSERKQLDNGYDFLLRARNELHYLQKRNGDILTLQLQGKVAPAFGFTQRDILRRIEEFMREYYRHAQKIHLLSGALEKRLAAPFLPKSINKTQVRPTTKKIGVFTLKNGLLDSSESRVFSQDPARVLELFLLAQEHNATLAPELGMRLQRRLNLLGRLYLNSAANRQRLLTLFSRKGQVGRLCRLMHELGILGKLFPEFAPLTCLVQHEFFHRYTADEHTLVCLEALDKVAHETQPPFTKYKPLLEKIQRTHLLYLAILLHDTGRAQNSRNHSSSGAANADKVSRRLHLPPEEASTLRFLVESHLAMADTARSRNLEDDETIIRFARLVQTRERLDMLMLLSFADHEGTGTQPTSTDWFELVMWRLYNRTSQWLAESSGSRRAEEKSTDALRVKIRQKLTGAVPEIEVDAHFDNLPSRYFAMLPSALIESHIRLIHAFLVQQISSPDSALLPVVAWEDPSAAAYSEVSIVTWDREKLFSRITGSFAACDLNILSADIFTRTDHIVVDTFRVANARGEAVTNPRDRQVFKTIVEHALSKTDFSFHGLLEKKRPGPLGLEGLRFPTRITFDLGTSSRYTILDIQTPDRPGLLYDISSVLADCGVNIDCARIATEKGAALDTFYLRGIDGHKITNSELLNDLSARLRSRLES